MGLKSGGLKLAVGVDLGGMNRSVRCVTREKWKILNILLHCNGMAEERKEMVMLMIEIVEGWQEMEGKDKVVCVVDRACENGRVQKEVERLYKVVGRSHWIE